MKGVFEKYLLALRKTRVDDKTEHTDRSALESLLQAIADEVDAGISVQHAVGVRLFGYAHKQGAGQFAVFKMAAHYTRTANRKWLAAQAMEKLNASRTSIPAPSHPVRAVGEKSK